MDWRLLLTDLQVPAKESLEEATLAAASRPQHVAAEDTALGLFLLQINALVTGHWKNKHTHYTSKKADKKKGIKKRTI